jgi:hypothetical protein
MLMGFSGSQLRRPSALSLAGARFEVARVRITEAGRQEIARNR